MRFGLNSGTAARRDTFPWDLPQTIAGSGVGRQHTAPPDSVVHTGSPELPSCSTALPAPPHPCLQPCSSACIPTPLPAPPKPCLHPHTPACNPTALPAPPHPCLHPHSPAYNPAPLPATPQLCLHSHTPVCTPSPACIPTILPAPPTALPATPQGFTLTQSKVGEMQNCPAPLRLNQPCLPAEI